jgi:hypothetical protein
MNINIVEKTHSNVAYADSLDVELPLGFNPNDKYSQEDLLVARLLSVLRSFYNSVVGIRKKYSLKVSTEFNIKAEPLQQVKLTAQILDKISNLDNLLSDIDNLVVSYRLPRYWSNPVLSAILYNKLILPTETPVGLYVPKQLKDLRENLSLSTVKIEEALQYPAIYFKRETSAKELRRWLRENSESFKFIQKDLPKKRDIRIKDKTIFWGYATSLFIAGGETSWTKISEELYRLVDESEFSSPKDRAEVPGPTDIEKYYKRFIDSLKKVSL